MSIGDIARLTFKLDDDFIAQFKGLQPDWGPIGYVVYKRTYARQTDDNTEEYYKTVKRVVEGCFSIQKNHCSRYFLPWNEEKAQRSAQTMFEKIWDFKFVPPGRGFWSMGTDHITKVGSMALNNCGFVSTKDIATGSPAKPFIFAMDCLMLGVGIGFDTLGANTVLITSPGTSNLVYKIPDTREGWVESVRLLIEGYLEDEAAIPAFEYDLIRKEGEPINGFGGVASGPRPLKDLHEAIHLLFKDRIGQALTSTDIVDIMNMIGKCVVAGNVRRSAELAIGQADDIHFIELKDPEINLDALVSHRWASNNSVDAHVGMDYKDLAKLTAKNGEPGYIWLDNMRDFGRMKDGRRNADPLVMGANPCVEQNLESYELCCLVETFPARHSSLAEYLETLKFAYLYAKTVTLMPTHWSETNNVMMRNRRIGCSQSGIIRAFQRHGRREMYRWCDEAYESIQSLDKKYSEWLGVRQSIKKTSVKPSGTVSLLCGETPGIHYPIGEYYIRRVRFAKDSEWVSKLKDAGYKVEPDVTQPNSTMVAEFPVQEKYFVKSEEDTSMWEQLENVAQYQYYWADNSVSATIKFKEEEGSQIESALELYESRLKAISFLPHSNHGYAQAPFEKITKEQYIEMSAKVDSTKLYANITEVGDGGKNNYCDGDKCEIDIARSTN